MDKPKIIAVDFDGTLCTNNWPEIGEPNERLIEYLKIEKKQGSKIILWTCRADEKLNAAVEWCKERELIFDVVNENLPEIIKELGSDTRKIFANEYIDDKSERSFNLPFVGGGVSNYRNVNDSFLVGVDFTRNKDVGVLIVGQKRMNQSVDIINAFQGQEAWDLYEKLVTSKPVFLKNRPDNEPSADIFKNSPKKQRNK